METPSLICPEGLATTWPDTLRRDGFRVASTGDEYSGLIYYERQQEPLLMHKYVDGFACDLSVIKDQPARLRIECIFLASGARYNFPIFESEPAQVLWRCDRSTIPMFLDKVKTLGMFIEVQELESFGGMQAHEAERHLVGLIGEGKDRVALDTGPAFDPTRKTAVSFIRLRPTKIWLRIPMGQLKVIAQARDVLSSLRADIVVTMPVLDKVQKGKAI